MVSTRRKKAAEAEEVKEEIEEPTPPPPPKRARRSRVSKEKSATPSGRLKSKTPSVEEPEEVKECVKLGKDVEMEYCKFVVASKKEPIRKEESEDMKPENEEFSILDNESELNPEGDVEVSPKEELSPDEKKTFLLIEQEIEKNVELESQPEPEPESQHEPEPEPESELLTKSKSSSPMDISDNDEKEEEVEVPPVPKEPEFIEIEQPKYRRPHAFHPAAAAFEEETELVKIPKPPVPPEEFLPIMGIKPIVLKTQTRPGTNPNPLLFSSGKPSRPSIPVPPVAKIPVTTVPIVEQMKPTFFNVTPIAPRNPPSESHSLSGPMIIAPAAGRRREEERTRESRPSVLEISTRTSRRVDRDRSSEREKSRRSSEREKSRRSIEHEKSSRDDRYRDNSTSSYHHRSSHRDEWDRREKSREKDRRHSNNYHNHSRKYEPSNDYDRSRERRRDDRERSPPPRREKEKEEEKKEKIIEKETIPEKKVEEKKEKEEEKVVVVEKSKSPTIPIEEMVVPAYEKITECKYLTKNASKKKTLSLICECHATGRNCSDDDCVNRAMYTECPASCPATKCKNQRFTKKKYSWVEAFHTGTKKGCGLRALRDIRTGQFIMEYVGEMLERDEYADRKDTYSEDKEKKHHYFCDTGSHTIDATTMGNESRFINHSCNPNAVCEKWMVPKTPGAVNRIGFFAKRPIAVGEEITFDYQFVNYGRDAQECYCGAENCTGYIGERPNDDDDSSDEEDESDDELITTDELDDEEKRIADLDYLSESEREKAIDEMLADLIIRNRKHSRKVIQIAERMTNYEQRVRLIDEIFSQDTSVNTQSHYAEEGIGNLMYEWLRQQDWSVENLKLCQKVLQVLHGEVFVAVAKSHKGLLEVVAGIGKENNGPEGINVQSVVDSLVACVDTGDDDYHKIEEITHNEMMANFNRLREMAFRLNNHWFNRSVTFRIPKKVREPSPPPKSNEKLPSLLAVSSREPASSYYQDVSSKHPSPQPRFFDSRSEYGSAIAGRYGGYRSYTATNSNGEYYRGNNNYRRKYPGHENGSTTYFNQSSSSSYRKRSRYSRSRSRSSSPTQSLKRPRHDDRRSPSETSRKPVTPPTEVTPSVSSSGDAASKLSSSNVQAIPPPAGPPPPPRIPTRNIQPPQVHYDYAQAYVDHSNSYGAYSYFPRNSHHPMGAYPPAPPMNGYPPHQPYWPTGHRPPLTFESFPTFEEAKLLYASGSLEQLNANLAVLQKMTVSLCKSIGQREIDEENAAATAAAAAAAAAVAIQQQIAKAAMSAANEKVREPPPKRERYTWAKAKAENGETYYFNKETKQTQWSPPSSEQGEVDPTDMTPPDTTGEDNKSQQGRQSSLQVRIGELVENASTEADKNREREEREREIARRKVEAAKQRQIEENRRVEMQKQLETKTKDFKSQLERIIAPIVIGATRSVPTSTNEKVLWLVKQLVKEMFKRQSSEEGFTYSLTDTAKLKVKKYTESLMERKVKNGGADIWKGYQTA